MDTTVREQAKVKALGVFEQGAARPCDGHAFDDNRIDQPPCMCGIGALGFAEGVPMQGETFETFILERLQEKGYTPAYLAGFVDGFCDMWSPWNRNHHQNPDYDEGRTDGAWVGDRSLRKGGA